MIRSPTALLASAIFVCACGGRFTGEESSGGRGLGGDPGEVGSGGFQQVGGSSAAPGGSGGETGAGGRVHDAGPVGSGGSAGGGGSGSGGQSASGGSSGSGGGEWDACTLGDTCILEPRSCCGVCEPADLESFVPVNARLVEARRKATCDPQPACAPCRFTGPRESQHFGAYCDGARCTAFDVRQSSWSSCEKSSDCRLRMGLGCCESCVFGTDLPVVAVSASREVLDHFLCGSTPTACPACSVRPPNNLEARCANRACIVGILE